MHCLSGTNHQREDERGSSGLDDPESNQGGGLDAGEQVNLVNHVSNNGHKGFPGFESS